MSSELGKKVSKAQKRLTRMIDYLGVEHDSIQQLQSQLELIYGKEFIGEPHITYGGLTEEQRNKLESVVDTYLSSAYSTKRSFKKMMQNKGFSKFLKNNSNQTIEEEKFWDAVFKSSTFNHIKEMYYKASEEVIDITQDLVDLKGFDSNSVISIFKDYMQLSSKEKEKVALREYVDKMLPQKLHEE